MGGTPGGQPEKPKVALKTRKAILRAGVTGMKAGGEVIEDPQAAAKVRPDAAWLETDRPRRWEGRLPKGTVARCSGSLATGSREGQGRCWEAWLAGRPRCTSRFHLGYSLDSSPYDRLGCRRLRRP